MRSMGIASGDAVLVVEHRGEQDLVYHGLVASISMQERLLGAHGEPAIEAVFIGPRLALENFTSVVHISHRDWLERRAGLAYEELPGCVPGMCRYCKCTEARACPGGCAWLYPERTVCSSPACEAKFVRENLLRTAGRAV